MDLEMYKKKLGAKSTSEALVNASINQVKSMFKESPLYQVIDIDGVRMGVRVSYEKENQKQLLLQPEVIVSKGQIATFNENRWLITEFIADMIYPKAKIALCNQILKWADDTTTYEFPCVARGKGYKLDESDKYVLISEGDIVIQTPLNAGTAKIKEKQRFMFGSRAYEVAGIDNITHVFNNGGILEITLQITSISDTDDDDLADNGDDTGWGGGW